MNAEPVAGELDKIATDARRRIESAPDKEVLEELRVELLGKKGVLTGALRGLGSLPADQRAAAGARANALKTEIDQRLDARRQALEQNRLENLADAEWVDVTFVPEGAATRGHLHPLTQAQREITAIFSRLGYQVALGPEVEDDYHNFQALNIPEGHPARHEATDAGHESQFHQVEGLLVDADVRMSDLVGTIEYFSRSMFGADRRIRITGDHFPFTEPSIGAAVSCGICKGVGCSSCKGGWLEIMGAGMVHPQVLRNGGIDPEHYSGFAFGAGPERITMLKYGIDDIRYFFSNDLRFLEQFG